MGIPWKASPEELAAKAKAEHDAGRQRFIALIRLDISRKEYASEEWSAAVEAIEGAGWVVDHFSVAERQGRADDAYFLFKRR
ncbi:hypothetical protein [Amycolatopsis taiwanensis]|uniref:Uncharacterized protein n=1 Tax=Amycolatopsis taiwanensis TaxID=342230 RepID=A0A9W6VCT2_9PSEU|nr:hypothetical protein [Amycolatopsis taiwanensis]GLY66518.1 hypothetical protein Atai01_31370 [Amycolatopsis taiwanensis]